MLALYRSLKEEFSLSDPGSHHIDIPFSEKTQQRALSEAGFVCLRVPFSTKTTNVCVATRISATDGQFSEVHKESVCAQTENIIL
jgi:hypothetical protein